jgi:IclR family KDG regulon transcriptional repressor
MRRSLAWYSAPVSFAHVPSWADFITITVGFRVFGTHTLHLLDVVADFSEPPRFSDIQKMSGLAKGTLHRLLKQLEGARMLSFDERTQRYQLGLRLLRLAHSAWEGSSFVESARSVLDGLAEKLGVTIHLGCLEQSQVLYLDKRFAKSAVRMFSAPGRVVPVYCTAPRQGNACLSRPGGA